MPTRSEAEEHLRAIRSLMEKATIYRALSAPAAAVAGILSLLNCWLLVTALRGADSITFVGSWMAVLAVTLAISILLLWQDARRRSEVFFSAGMRSAIKAMTAPLLAGACFTLSAIDLQEPLWFVMWWLVFYGLGLLAMAHFAPRSIGFLGTAFLAAGLLIQSVGYRADRIFGMSDGAQTSVSLMALTFGLFHIIYAACTWPRKRTQADAGAMP